VLLIALWTLCCNGAWQVNAASEAFLTPPYGPLRLVNQQPTQLLFLQSFPEEASVTPPGRVGVHLNVALTNTLISKEDGVTAEIDVEMLRTVLDVRYGVRAGFEIGLELPLLYTSGGILDDSIFDVEDFFTEPRIIRRSQVSGRMNYRVARGNRLFIAGQDDALGLGDVVLKAKVLLLREQERFPAVSLRAALKFPSGDASRAFGSGEFDGGLGVLLQKTFGRWTFYLNGDVTFPGQAFDDAGISLQPFFSGVFAIEYRLSNPFSLVVQVRGDTRPFHDTVSALDKHIIETLLGANWALSRHLVLQIGLAEDQFNTACCAADVSFFVNLTGRW
jgi:hypothetical protein